MPAMLLVAMGVSLAFAAPSAQAKDDGDVPITREEAGAILEELKQIRQVLERIEKQGVSRRQPTGPTTAKVSAKGRPVLGSDDAPVTIVEFTDYQCPFCKRFAENTLPQLQKKYIDTGKVRLVIKDMPLGFHKDARKAAQAAHCAGEQGRFWEMHKLLYANNRQLQSDKLADYARQAGAERKKFEACLAAGKYLQQIDADALEAQKAGLTGTPSFVIGKTTSDTISGEVIRGAQPLTGFDLHLKKFLPDLKQ